MRIVVASSEAVPFSKTGGLADVATALADALAAAGAQRLARDSLLSAGSRQERPRPTASASSRQAFTFEVPIGTRHVRRVCCRRRLPGSAVTFLLVDQLGLFRSARSLSGRTAPTFATTANGSFSSAGPFWRSRKQLRLRPDIIHANDWQTGLIPALLSIEGREPERFETTASVFTIHNMAFQGTVLALGHAADGARLEILQLETDGVLQPAQPAEDGHRLRRRDHHRQPDLRPRDSDARVRLRARWRARARAASDLVGILNGVDTKIWNPQTDPALPVNYSIADIDEGKRACKRALQEEFGLPSADDVPLLAIVSRLTDQKGLDLVVQAAETLLSKDLQLCVLGSGEAKYRELADRNSRNDFPEKVAVRIGFDDGLAHRIEAGADLFLMPSRFEPCGLNQMYSLIYGTVPHRPRVGGLADSVVDATSETWRTARRPVSPSPTTRPRPCRKPSSGHWPCSPTNRNGCDSSARG